MRSHVFSFLLFVCSVNSRVVEPTAKPMKVVSWNVLASMWIPSSFNQNDYDADRSLLDVDVRVAKQIYTLKKLDPDIICLQEVDEYSYKLYSDALTVGYDRQFSPHERMHWEEFIDDSAENQPNGNAVFYRKDNIELVESESVKLSDDGNMGAMSVFNFNGHTIISACLHFEGGFLERQVESRRIQINSTLAYMNTKEGKLLDSAPTLLVMGDLNEVSTAKPSQLFFNDGYRDVFTDPKPPTLYSIIGPVVLDHIYYKPGKETGVQNSQVPDISNANFDYNGNVMRTRKVMQAILSYKMENILQKNLSPFDTIKEMLAIYEFVRPSRLHLSKESNGKFRSVRFGSDHLYLYTEFLFGM